MWSSGINVIKPFLVISIRYRIRKLKRGAGFGSDRNPMVWDDMAMITINRVLGSTKDEISKT